MCSTLRRAEYAALQSKWTSETAERQRLAREIAEREARLREVDTSIQSIREGLALLAPVNILPDDVMIDILRVAYLHDFPHCRADDGLYNTHSPIAFSQVCRRWRRLALGMASLWTCIHVTPLQTKGYPEMAKLYLTRSRNRALSVSFVCYSDPLSRIPYMDASWEFFNRHSFSRYWTSWEILLEQSHRWKACALFSTFGKIAARLTHSLTGRILPRLQYFRHQLYDEEFMPRAPVRFFAPNLKHLDLHNLCIRVPETDAFRRLTELKVASCCEVSEILNALRHCAPSLEKLTLSHIHLHHGFGDPIPVSIHLPRLHILALISYCEESAWNGTFISVILRGAPALDELIISNANIVVEEHQDSRLPLSQSLRILRYGALERDCAIIRNDMPPPFPELRELELFAIAPRVLDAIFHLYQSSRIISWPRLQTLILPPQATIPESTLLRFVKHRTQIGYPVSTIKASAQTLKELSREALAILASHPVQLICHAEDAGSHRLYEIWDVTRNVPVYLPWHGSLRWWDQF